MIKYDLSKFSPTPFGRYPDDGKFNGTAFRKKLIELLNEAKVKNDTLEINFDNISLGIGSSFLEESFGGLVRKGYFNKDDLIGNKKLLKIKSNQAYYIEEINNYISEAEVEKS
ncbi:STAS-like domain-containing protein [Pseudoalteromonas carrageenovora]|uniref:STAS-like domain-containing protein n=1 Tax=Pseudoalteromonas carrageenovora TaxID=227 RepID=UPI00311D7503